MNFISSEPLKNKTKQKTRKLVTAGSLSFATSSRAAVACLHTSLVRNLHKNVGNSMTVQQQLI